MDNERSSAGYWATAIIVVLAVAAAVWWYTTANTSPLVPNTGAEQTDTASNPLDYVAE
jgi:hypothetical protein